MHRSYIPTTVEELRIGLRYGREHFAIPLHGDTLERVFDNALERYTERKGTSRQESFSTSVFRALKAARVPNTRFKAYYAAICAMGSHRRSSPFPLQPVIIAEEGPLRPDEMKAMQALYGLGDNYLPLNS